MLQMSPLWAWGPVGHKLTGDLAQPLLTVKAQHAVKNLLGNETLAEATLYLDKMRSDKRLFWQKTASPWHYVTLPKGQTYSPDKAPEKEMLTPHSKNTANN
ncbi:S1/P1 nuclease [Catenovulum sediminis]|uniref:S1/P1 nuclease n=1 Tax=Catenovulum sediminis TaxID=1740262 RepID=UPI00163D514E|nr:S1/P1 nuclease [Catenovulum sediminis]